MNQDAVSGQGLDTVSGATHWRRRCRDRHDGEMRGQSVIVADCNLISAILIAY